MFFVTRMLIAAFALRLMAAIAVIAPRLMAAQDPESLDFKIVWPIVESVTVWAGHELPNALVWLADIVLIEGLYRAWRNLVRIRRALTGAAA